MKKIYLLIALLVCSQSFAQQMHYRKNEQSLFQRLTAIEKKSNRFNLYLNMQTGFYTGFNQNGTDGFSGGAFKMPELRLEAKGKVNDWLSYRWRQRLNKSYEAKGVDGLPLAVDVAGLGFKATERLSFFVGRQCVAYGGFEFDANPIEIYQYSEIVDHMNIFMTGITASYDFTPTQQMVVQVLNSNAKDATEFYGDSVVAGSLPLVYSLGWNASMFDNAWQTRWSLSAMNEIEGKYMYYVALGNQFNISKKWNMYIDFMGSIENIDRKGIMTEILESVDGYNVENALYGAVVAKVNYRFLPKWNVFVKGMFDCAGMLEDGDTYSKGNYRTSLGYLAGIEYYPMADSNLHFFCTFVGQTNLFTERASAIGKSDYSTQRASLGLIYKLPVF